MRSINLYYQPKKLGSFVKEDKQEKYILCFCLFLPNISCFLIILKVISDNTS